MIGLVDVKQDVKASAISLNRCLISLCVWTNSESQTQTAPGQLGDGRDEPWKVLYTAMSLGMIFPWCHSSLYNTCIIADLACEVAQTVILSSDRLVETG